MIIIPEVSLSNLLIAGKKLECEMHCVKTGISTVDFLETEVVLEDLDEAVSEVAPRGMNRLRVCTC